MHLHWIYFTATTYDEAARPTPDTATYSSEDAIAEAYGPGRVDVHPTHVGEDPLLCPGRPVKYDVRRYSRSGDRRASKTLWIRAEAVPVVAATPGEYLNRAAVAGILGVKPDTITQYLARGRFPEPDRRTYGHPEWLASTIACLRRRPPGRPQNRE